MSEVKAKKYLGQHFLTDESIARRIVDSLPASSRNVLEIGPGMGVLTKYLAERPETNLHAIEIDRESVSYLQSHYPQVDVIEADFLRYDLSSLFQDSFAVIGNFPYNISSQILFKVFDCRNQVSDVVGMFQKEVAERVSARHGSKAYGILSVLLSAYYDIEYLFTVSEHVFNPPPKVKSAVIRLKRNGVATLGCSEQLFVKVVKAGFNQRRKTLRNALRSAGFNIEKVPQNVLSLRAEQLSTEDFISLVKIIESCQ